MHALSRSNEFIRTARRDLNEFFPNQPLCLNRCDGIFLNLDFITTSEYGLDLAYETIANPIDALKAQRIRFSNRTSTNQIISYAVTATMYAVTVGYLLKLYLNKEVNVKQFEAKGASGVLMDVRTGEVLALVSLPDFESLN